MRGDGRRRLRSGRTPPALRRPYQGRVVAGVARGIADVAGVAPRLVRLLWIGSVPLTLGLSGAVYGLLAVMVPPGDPEPPGGR